MSIATLDRGVGFDGGKPDVDSVDGTASFAADGSSGVLFLFNPGPRPTQAYLMLDESLGISNAASTGTLPANEPFPSPLHIHCIPFAFPATR